MSFTLAVVAPAAPAAFDGVVALGACLAFIVCYGLLHSWKATLGRFLLWLANLGISVHRFGVHFSVTPFRFAARISTDVEKWLSQATASTERAMVKFFTAFYSWATWIVTAPFRLGEATYTALHNLAHRLTHSVPRVIRETVVKPITNVIHKTVTVTTHRVGNLTHALERAKAQLAHYAHALEHSIAATLPRVGITSKQLRRLARRTTRLEKATVGLGAVALVTAALGRMGLGWLKCPALGRVGRRVGCGGFGLLESLLALSFDAWLVTDLCRIVDAMTAAARLFAAEINYLATQISGLIQCQGASRPKPLPVAWHEPPPVVKSLTL